MGIAFDLGGLGVGDVLRSVVGVGSGVCGCRCAYGCWFGRVIY